MKSMRSKVLTNACLMVTALSLSACGGGVNVVIPESLLAPCESTVDVSGAQTVGDLGRAVVAGDGDLRVCNIKKDAVVAIATAQNRRWFEFWR